MNQTEFIIGDMITFAPSGERLSLLSDPDTNIVLTPACSRLLEYLISSRGTVLSRDVIFSSLWEQYGYTPSNGSLNTYISLLRKAFVNLGFEEEIIITVPKVGFLLSGEIDVVAVDIPAVPVGTDELESDNEEISGENKDNPPEIIPPAPVLPDKPLKGRSLFGRTSVYLSLAGGAALIAGALLFVSLSGREPASTVIPVRVGQLDGCEIRYLPAHAGDTVMFTPAQAMAFVRSAGFACTPRGVYYLYVDKGLTSGQSGKMYVSYCEQQGETVKACKDFMEHNMTIPEVPVS